MKEIYYDEPYEPEPHPLNHETPKSRGEITRSLDQILLDLYMSEPEITKTHLTKCAEGLRSKYENYKQYELYYLLVSEKPEGQCPFFDFPNPDSVQTFIESLNPEA
jgi:hypothetical protein